jgi:hypothetical protein
MIVGHSAELASMDELLVAVRRGAGRALIVLGEARDQQGQSGRAGHQLINAAVGDDMTARVRAAVDVRD